MTRLQKLLQELESHGIVVDSSVVDSVNKDSERTHRAKRMELWEWSALMTHEELDCVLANLQAMCGRRVEVSMQKARVQENNQCIWRKTIQDG